MGNPSDFFEAAASPAVSISSPSSWRRWGMARLLMKPLGGERWDIFFRATGVAAAAGILLLLFVPGSVTLVSLAMLSLPANSPLSPILPTLFEPVIMGATRYDSVVAVTLVATASYMYMEYVNWHVYSWVFTREKLAWLRDHGTVRWGVTQFARRPFWTVVIFAVTPLPFWIARSLAIVHRYPFRRYMVATLVGKAPIIFIYAWIGGLLHVPTRWLVALVVVTTAVAILSRMRRGEAVLSDPATIVIQGSPEPPDRPQSP